MLICGPGNDVLDGGEGDNIVIASGYRVTVNGFDAGAGSLDRIDLTRYGTAGDYDWLVAHARETGGSVVLDLGIERITLANVQLDALHADDFVFGGGRAPLDQPVMHDMAIAPRPGDAHLL